MSEPNVDYTVEEDGGVATEAVDEHVFELKERPKKGRAPMSEERKAVLREQLKAAREKKKALKLEGKEVAKAPKVVKVLEATETEPAVYVKNVKQIKDPESEALKKELAEMKKPPPKVDRPKPKPVEQVKQPQVESVAAKPDPRYSTYKKSIWEDFK